MSPRAGGAPSQRQTPKVQRWVDLLAALLRRRFPATFEELRAEVPAYRDGAGKTKDAVDKLFERDKEELRAYGVPVRTELSADGEVAGYRLDRRDFYLPYLALAGDAAGAPAPPRTQAAFYRALERLAADGGALALVAAAARRVEALGDPQLAADARAGARKLAFDRPEAAPAAGAGDARVVAEDAGVPPALFAELGQAVLQRRAVAFDYAALSTGATARRHAEPYGLYLTGGRWYLVARDRDRGAMRTFRVSRMRDLDTAARRGEARTFAVPADFRLADYAGREPWELGDAPPEAVEVEFPPHVHAPPGEPVPGEPSRRRFRVRRRDAFVRWLLGHAGDARPVSPPALVAAYRDAARAALDAHA